jgi:hypothetical protein
MSIEREARRAAWLGRRDALIFDIVLWLQRWNTATEMHPQAASTSAARVCGNVA